MNNNMNKLLKVKLNIPFLYSLLLSDVTLFNKCMDGTLLSNLKILLLEGLSKFILKNSDHIKMEKFIINDYTLNELFLYSTQPMGQTLVLFSKLWANLYNESPNQCDYSLFKYLIEIFNRYIKTNFIDYLNKSYSLNIIVNEISKLDYANSNKLGESCCSQSFAFLQQKRLQANTIPEYWWSESRKRSYLKTSETSEFMPNIIQLLNIMYLRAWCREIYEIYSYPIDIIDNYIIIEERYREKFLEVLRDCLMNKIRLSYLCNSLILKHLKPYPRDILILIKDFRASLAKRPLLKKTHILTLKDGKFDNSLITIINDYSTTI